MTTTVNATSGTTAVRPAAGASRPAGRRRGRSPAGRLTNAAGAGYVASWVLGLVLAPAAPQRDASAIDINTFYASNGTAVLLSSSFVHGTAAVALAAFALAVARATGAGGGLRRAVIGTALAAAALSVTQVILAALAVAGAGNRDDLFTGINLIDVLKIAFLAGFVAVATIAATQAGSGPRWLAALAIVLVPALVCGSAAFIVDRSALMSILAASLVGLLAWVTATTVLVGRTTR